MAEESSMTTRAVVTKRDADNPNNGLPDEEDGLLSKIVKYIPAEVVAFYTLYVGFPKSLPGSYYTIFSILGVVVGFFGTALYLKRVYGLT